MGNNFRYAPGVAGSLGPQENVEAGGFAEIRDSNGGSESDGRLGRKHELACRLGVGLGVACDQEDEAAPGEIGQAGDLRIGSTARTGNLTRRRIPKLFTFLRSQIPPSAGLAVSSMAVHEIEIGRKDLDPGVRSGRAEEDVVAGPQVAGLEIAALEEEHAFGVGGIITNRAQSDGGVPDVEKLP